MVSLRRWLLTVVLQLIVLQLKIEELTGVMPWLKALGVYLSHAVPPADVGTPKYLGLVAAPVVTSTGLCKALPGCLQTTPPL